MFCGRTIAATNQIGSGAGFPPAILGADVGPGTTATRRYQEMRGPDASATVSPLLINLRGGEV